MLLFALQGVSRADQRVSVDEDKAKASLALIRSLSSSTHLDYSSLLRSLSETTPRMLRRAHWLIPVFFSTFHPLSQSWSRFTQPHPFPTGSFLLSLTYEPVQRSLIYLHWVKWPLPFLARFDDPSHYGFSPGKVKNFYLETQDGARIGAWLVMAEDAYDDALRRGKLTDEGYFEESIWDSALR